MGLSAAVTLNNFDLGFVAAPHTSERMTEILTRFVVDGIDLVICPGTDAAIRWIRVNAEIPTLYFGVHPENNGLD